MSKGDSVVLQNLRTAVHLNGRHGTVAGYKGDRLVVCLENGVVCSREFFNFVHTILCCLCRGIYSKFQSEQTISFLGVGKQAKVLAETRQTLSRRYNHEFLVNFDYGLRSFDPGSQDSKQPTIKRTKRIIYLQQGLSPLAPAILRPFGESEAGIRFS